MIQIAIADDHQMFIDGVKSLLADAPEISITGEALNGEQLLSVMEAQVPDIVLLDINMPGLNGLYTTSRIRKQFPQTRILVLTMYKTKEFVNGMMRLGAHGYILKNTGKKELLDAIRTLHAGGEYYSREIAELINAAEEAPRSHATQDIPRLSKRETDIIRLIASGKTTAEIAEELFISPYTVETHRKNLLFKLNLRNTADLVRHAAQLGLLEE